MLEPFDQISLAKQLNGYSMRWYLFFVRVLSILWLILGPILFLSTMNQEVFDIYHGSYQNYFNNSRIGPYNSIVMILFWVGEVILLMSRSELKKLSTLGWQLIIIFFSINLASSLYTLLTYFQYSSASIIGSVSVPMILHTLNLMYFTKRRSLFVH